MNEAAIPETAGETAPRRVLLMMNLALGFTATMVRGVGSHRKINPRWTAFLDDPAHSDREFALLFNGQWDGVICGHATASLAAACARLGLPLVDVLDGPPLPGVVKIRPDNAAVGHVAAEYFLERRFRHFAFSGFSGLSWSTERRDGFCESLQLAGHPCRVHETDSLGDNAFAGDAWQVEHLGVWLRGLPKGPAVMACNDIRALQLVWAARAAGLRVPEDIAVMGANNDTEWCELASPEISSVALNHFEIGARAAAQLDALIEGCVPAVPDQRVEPVGVVERASTNTLALRDPKVAIALKFIQENACRGITVEEVVAQVHASRSQMESRFRRYLGRSPQAEIRRVQVEKIRHLLTTTDCCLKEIADQTGFDHVEYMSVLFKRLTGETPGQYRRNIQAQERVRALA